MAYWGMSGEWPVSVFYVASCTVAAATEEMMLEIAIAFLFNS